jgi:hypothetical protein
MVASTLNYPTQEKLKEIFNYDESGHLVWKIRRKRANIGATAGTIHPNGYLRTGINGKVYLNHRLIYVFHHGVLPDMVDHIDGNKLNNKIENLRNANNVTNQQNQKLKKENTSGYKNVSFCIQTKKWSVKIRIDGKSRTIGRYKDIELADLVAQETRAKYHGVYARSH